MERLFWVSYNIFAIVIKNCILRLYLTYNVMFDNYGNTRFNFRYKR